MASNTKTKSTGKPAKSRRRRRRLPARENAGQLPEFPLSRSGTETGPKLQIRPEPKPPTPGEQKILDLLWSEFNHSDDVARAAARFEYDVHERQVQRRIEEGFSEDEAGAVHRVFKADEFNDIYRRLMLLRMERALLRDLELDEYEADILRERIHVMFGPAPKPATKAITLSRDQVQIGDSEIQQVQDLKARGRRRKGS